MEIQFYKCIEIFMNTVFVVNKKSIKHFHLHHHQSLHLGIIFSSQSSMLSLFQKIDRNSMFLFRQSDYLTKERHMNPCRVFLLHLFKLVHPIKQFKFKYLWFKLFKHISYSYYFLHWKPRVSLILLSIKILRVLWVSHI